jgi:hypothetical protein
MRPDGTSFTTPLVNWPPKWRPTHWEEADNSDQLILERKKGQECRPFYHYTAMD